MKLSSLLTLVACMGIVTAAKADTLKVGDKAPEISGTTDAGKALKFGDVYKKQAYTLVYFYPKAFTGGCTLQGCSLRDADAELTKKGVAIIGVSADTVEQQKAFKEANHFAFTLISDMDKSVMKAFGQPGTGLAKREAYLIKDGKIVYKDEGVTDKQGENILAYLAKQKS